MPKLSALERTIRGLERCGFNIFVVVTAKGVDGIATMFPRNTEGRHATRQTISKWEREWRLISDQVQGRTIAEHLLETGRTEAATHARRAQASHAAIQ